jgi:hypothetical protein
MNLLLTWANASICGLLSMAFLAAVLSPKVHDGIVIKVGLIFQAAGFGSMSLRLFDGVRCEEVLGLERSLMLVNAGIVVVILGYLMRKARVHHPVRRSTDWAALMDTRPMEQDR